MVTLTIDQYSFHDGTLFEIEQTGRDLIISMESSCIGPEEISNHTLLSIWGTLRGQLHIDGVTAIYENNVLVTEITKKVMSMDIFLMSISKKTPSKSFSAGKGG